MEDGEAGIDELHSRVIESAKDILSEYLGKKEEFENRLVIEEKEKEVCQAKFEEIREYTKASVK